MYRQNALIKEMDGLKKFALRLTGNEADAEDLLQTTLLKALEHKKQFRRGTCLFSWTSKIMFNQFASEYRRRTKFESQYDPDRHIGNIHTLPAQEDKITLSETNQAISTLSRKHRQILFMVCINGMEYKVVANELGIPVGTVRSRLSRARTELQNRIDDKGYPRFTDTQW